MLNVKCLMLRDKPVQPDAKIIPRQELGLDQDKEKS